jgi:hypothetical protein
MNHAVRDLTLTLCLALTSAGFTFAQATSTQVVPAASAAPAATVYVGTTKGIYVYNESATGKLTLLSSKPDATPAGLLIGVTGKYLITLGTYIIHSYQLSSTGAIEKEMSQINTQDYPDNGNCTGNKEGTIGLASLNHAGKNVYVVFPLDTGSCSAAIQTYDISKSGDLIFNGGIMTGGNAGSGLYQAPAIIANDTYAYAASDFFCCGQSGAFSGYILGSNGEMQNWTFNMSDNVSPVNYAPMYVTADPTNHLAVILAQTYEDSIFSAQLASYAVDTQGNLSTTANAKNMPYPKVIPAQNPRGILNMSPSGKLLAVAGTLGLEIYHFNGAAPITPYSKLLTTDEIDHIHWDGSNHIFALSDKNNKLYVFTVTTTAITPVAGSPFAVPTGTPNALIVVPK